MSKLIMTRTTELNQAKKALIDAGVPMVRDLERFGLPVSFEELRDAYAPAAPMLRYFRAVERQQ